MNNYSKTRGYYVNYFTGLAPIGETTVYTSPAKIGSTLRSFSDPNAAIRSSLRRSSRDDKSESDMSIRSNVSGVALSLSSSNFGYTINMLLFLL